MPRSRLRRTVVAGTLALAMLSASPITRADVPAPVTPEAFAHAYQGAWEYRWGDSPRDPTGAPVWATPTVNDGWRALPPKTVPEGRGGEHFLWMRTRLVGAAEREPVLYLQGVDQLVEAYVDGALVYRFGSFEGNGALRFQGYKTHFIPLGSNFAGKTLALRVYSDHVNIGPYGEVLLGSRADLALEAVRDDLPTLAMGILLVSVGLFVLGLFLSERRDKSNLAYGLLALSLGIYLPAAVPIRGLLLDAPLFWIHVELASLYLTPLFFASYFEHVFGPGRFRLLRGLQWVHGAYFLGSALVVALGLVPVLRTLLPFQILLLITIALMTARAILNATRGNLDARIFTAGFILAATAVSHDVLQAIGLVPRDHVSFGHVGTFAFALSLGIILARRFVEVHERMGRYSRVLELSLASAQVLDRGGQARVALDEIVRLLGARAALLFVTPEGGAVAGAELEVAAGREAGGVEIPLASVIAGFASNLDDLVEQVRLRREARVWKRIEDTRRSAMAAPLLVRDELLGVLYLESDESRRHFDAADLSLLNALGEKLSINIVSTRAVRAELESSLHQKRIAEQAALLEAAARLASGDIKTPIPVDEKSEFADLARGLDQMRRDVQQKIRTIEAKKTEVEVLNEELRRKIQQHTSSLLSSLRTDVDVDEDDLVTAAPSFAVGALIAERYRVIEELGQGAMGVVYEVERVRDTRRFAMKVLTSRSDKLAMARFVREAQILSRLDHPNLASIADVDVTPEGLLYLVMELCKGKPLHRCKERYRDVAWCCSVLGQMAAGLAAVHAQGVIHRDLKPGNVMVADDAEGHAQVKLVDFGISTLTGEVQERAPASERPRELDTPPSTRRSIAPPPQEVTRTGILVGTPTYMGPELAQGSRHWKAHSDVFSLGVIAYEILTGKRPFNVPPIFVGMQGQTLPRPTGLRRVEGLQGGLALLFERCMDPDPAARPTAQEVAEMVGKYGYR
ncbi:protein kinase domain-containing protein [Polyangium jinanense]|uniref:non-specific serine/threonine protein kinase n=1 Tax=Polyangium jinanense TaxID=2829994 RepID=A0A9X4AY97_9BACT|nr:protein kinase [Polyangium jinanense]MDC3961210.1 protein kinase [Polyangium jinanense]MDC3988596.1 protein kinase [Polyangium jinanense]